MTTRSSAMQAVIEELSAIVIELRALILQVADLGQRLKTMDELQGHQLAEILEAVHFKPKTEGTK